MSTLTTAENQTEPQKHETPYIAPRASIREAKEGYLLQLEMPGVSKEALELTVENHELTLIGRRSDAPPKGEPVYRESRPRDYRRVFELDPTIDIERITAKMDQGVVTLTLPKAEKLKPRRIPVGD